MRTTHALVALTLTLGFVLGGCGDDEDASAPAAGSTSASASVAQTPGPATDGALLVYSGRQEGLVAPIFEAFEQETGIDVEVRYGDTAQLAAQLIEEGDRTDADVFFSQDGGALGALGARDQLATLPEDILDRVPEQFRADDGSWVGTSGRSRVIVYDPDQLTEDEVPDTVLDLTEPEWNGKVGLAPSNASFQAFVTALRVLEGEDVARDWLAGIAANDPQIFDNNIAILNAAEDGLISVGLINHYYWYEQVAEEGLDAVPARLKFLPDGDAGALINVAGAAVLEGSDQSEAAEALVEFLVSDQAQEIFAGELKEYPLIDGVPLAEDLPELDTLDAPDFDLSDLAGLEETLTMLEDAGLT